MFDVTLDHDVLARLVERLELWTPELPNAEWSHLVALLGLGSAAVASAVGAPGITGGTAGGAMVVMGSPGFADALSAAADAVLAQAANGHAITITVGPELSRWAAARRPHCP